MWRSDQLSYRTLTAPSDARSVWRSDQLSYRTLTAPSDARDARPRVSFEKTTPAAREPAKAKSQARRPSRKEVFQPHLPVRLPCYDLAPITGLALTRPSRLRASGTAGFHGLTGGVYKARERIHRAVADARLLANPASWSGFRDSLHVAMSLPSVPAIVTRVWPRT